MIVPFLTPWFAIAGLAAAAGPVIIHLLSRRRFRVVQWAAVDFLRQAVRRRRRMLRLRDLALLALRVFCVVAFGAALARPYRSQGMAPVDSADPIHAVLVVDNGLWMGYEESQGTLLSVVKLKASRFIEKLPDGSRISVVGLCDSPSAAGPAHRNREDAHAALEAIEPTDRYARAGKALRRALEACRRAPDVPAKQVLLFTAGQSAGWKSGRPAATVEKLPGPIHVIRIAPAEPANTWVEEFRLRDEIADTQSPAAFLVKVRYQGLKPRNDVRVTLLVDHEEVDSRTIDLEPSQTVEILFDSYRFDAATKPGQPAFVPAEVTVTPDDLPADDRRFLMVPVVSALPVVFVDQYGDDEDPKKNRFGETYHLRHLLAPATGRAEASEELIRVRRARIEEVDANLLADARLVVVAGVADPRAAVAPLRQYVVQGGNLLIAAGGAFDPKAWNDSAWLDGAGVLPAPLRPTPVGHVPGEVRRPVVPFFLDFNTMKNRFFLLEQIRHDQLEEYYRQPYFFKAIDSEFGEEIVAGTIAAETSRIESQRARLDTIDRRLRELEKIGRSGRALSAAEISERDALGGQRRAVCFDWLGWENHHSRPAQPMPCNGQLAAPFPPHVRARFTDGVPFLAQRRIGRGNVLWIATGMGSGWNTLYRTDAMFLYDRIVRQLLRQTIASRDIGTAESLREPVPANRLDWQYTLVRPDGTEEPMAVRRRPSRGDVLVTDDLPHRGICRVVGHGPRGATADPGQNETHETALAVNGPVEASIPDFLTRDDADEYFGPAEYRWIDRDERIELSSSRAQGREFWRWLILAVLIGLLLEWWLLARPAAGEHAP